MRAWQDYVLRISRNDTSGSNGMFNILRRRELEATAANME